MPRHLHLERLEIDLRGIPPEVARAAAASLGPELAQALAAHLHGRGAATDARAAQLVAPAVKVSAGADATAVRAAIVRQVATTVAGQISPPSSAPR